MQLNFLLSKKVKIILILSVLIFLGSFLRFYQLGEMGYWIDEGFTIMTSEAIKANGYPLLNSGFIEKKDLLLPYLIAFLNFEKDNEFLMRLIPAMAGAVSILLIYATTKLLFNYRVGLFAAFLMAFSYWNIAWSRQVRGYSLLVMFFLLALIFLILYDKKKHWFYFLSVIIFSLLAFLSKNIGIFILLGILVYLLFKKKYKIFLLVMVFLIFIGIKTGIFVTVDLVPRYQYLLFYLYGYFWNFYGLIFVSFVSGIYLLIVKRINNQKKAIHLFCLAVFIMTLAYISFYPYVNQYRYVFYLTPLIFIYAAFLFDNLLINYKKKALLIFLALFVIDLIFFHALSFKPKSFYVLEDYTPQPNFKAVYDFLKTEINQNDVIISPYPYMDLIYLNRADYALPISYTGKTGDNSIFNGKEYYSGVEKVVNFNKILEDSTRRYYFIMDKMALSRVDKKYINMIQQDNEQIFILTNNTESVMVYRH